MPDRDEAFFGSLLKESREECLKYEIPQKDQIHAIFQGQQDLWDAMEVKQEQKDAMKKEGLDWEVIKPVHLEWKELYRTYKTNLANIGKAVLPILDKDVRFDSIPQSLKTHMMKCAILTSAGAKELADFCKENGSSAVMELLENEDLMQVMLTSGVARKNLWGPACKLYGELMSVIDDRGETVPCHQRLAMAVELELDDPLFVFETKDAIDPDERFLNPY